MILHVQREKTIRIRSLSFFIYNSVSDSFGNKKRDTEADLRHNLYDSHVQIFRIKYRESHTHSQKRKALTLYMQCIPHNRYSVDHGKSLTAGLGCADRAVLRSHPSQYLSQSFSRYQATVFFKPSSHRVLGDHPNRSIFSLSK